MPYKKKDGKLCNGSKKINYKLISETEFDIMLTALVTTYIN